MRRINPTAPTIETIFLNQEDSPCNGVENISIIVQKRRLHHHKKRKKIKQTQQFKGVPKLSSSLRKNSAKLSKRSSMPEFTKAYKKVKLKVSSSDTIAYKSHNPYSSKFFVNAVSEYHQPKSLNPFKSPLANIKWRVYRCQLSTQDDSCCCSCNSDAMFEVMKSLYDCYKKKNCDNCNCILCGHMPREERKSGELRKSRGALSTVGVGTDKQKAEREKKKQKTLQAEKDMVGKSPAEKEKILKDLAMSGAPLPEGKTASEKELVKKVKTAVGLPEAKSAAEGEKIKKAMAAGIITPLEGKSPSQKEKILKQQAQAGVPLPEGRTPSEKALIAKVKAETKRAPSAAGAAAVPSEKLRKAKAAGFLTPLEGKTPEQKEKILKGLAMSGVPLPEAKTPSEKKLIDKVRTEVGLPPEPKSSADKKKYQQALTSGIVTPLEGKSKAQKEKILKSQAEAGLPLPEGRTPSEKALIAKVKAETKRAPSAAAVPSEKLRKAKAAGFLTPLEGKTPEQKEKILKGLAMSGVPLPEAKTPSEKKLIDKVRTEVGLPPEPKSSADKKKYQEALKSGIVTPLEGKSKPQKEKILKSQAEAGLPLPEGRTPSEKALIAKVKAETKRAPSAVAVPSEKLRKAKAAGFLTPLEGKTPEQKEKILRGLAMSGVPLPEAKTPSEKKLIDKVRTEVGLPPEPKSSADKKKYQQALKSGIVTPLEGKSKAQKEKILKSQAEAGLPLPEGRTPSEKALVAKVKAETKRAPSAAAVPSEKLRKAKAAGLLTPLEGKTPEQKEKILKGQLEMGLPLPEGRTASEKALIQKVKAAGGDKRTKSKAVAAGAPALPPEKAKKLDEKTAKVMKEGKGPSDECICGLLTPESERVSVGKTAAVAGKSPSERLKAAKAAGLLTPLAGKTPEQKEKILKGLAKQGIPLPEGKTASEKKLIDKVRADVALPPEPKTPSTKEKYAKAQAQGIITPLDGKSPSQKEKILKAQADAGLPLPEGRTQSEKALINKVKAAAGAPAVGKIPSEKLRKAKAAGLLTPLSGKTPAQKEKILRGLTQQGIPLPEGKTPSEKKIIDKVRADLGIPPEPKTPSMKEKYAKAQAQGIMTPLEGKSKPQKEKILKSQAEAGLPLPEGRTPSEKALIAKVKAETKRASSAVAVPSEKLRKAKAAGFLTPLEGKTPEQKEKILRGLAMSGVPLPEAKTPSEKKIIDKVRTEVGLPPEPKSSADKKKYQQALKSGIVTPLEGKSKAQKEKILKSQAEAGLPLPEGRTPSEKALVAKVKAETKRAPSASAVPSEKLRKAKAAGLLTPLEGKTPEQKEKILKGQLEMGLPLPEGRTASEKALIQKVKAAGGDKRTKSKAVAAGAPALPPEKAKKLDEKTAKVMKEGKGPSDECICGLLTPESERVSVGKTAAVAGKSPSERLKAAKAAGLLTPLAGKTPEQKEKILKGLAKQGIPLPEGKTASEKKLIDKVRADVALPPEPKTPSTKEKYAKAQAQGIITPLDGKSPSQKEKILKAQADAGLPLPEGRTQSEKALINKVKAAAGAPAVGKIPSEKLRKAKAAGLLTPLSGKTPAQKEKILRGLTQQGIPLPEGKTPSEKALVEKVRAEAGRTSKIPSEKLREAKAAGLLTPLEGKTPAQKEKILKGLVKAHLPLPEAKSPSDKDLVRKVREELGLPPEPKSPSIKEKYKKALATGVITPLEGKTPAQKDNILKKMQEAGIPLPEGRTPSEKALVRKIKATAGAASPSKVKVPSEKIKAAKAAGFLTPLEGKTPAQKEKIIRGLAMSGMPLPEGKTPSEKEMIRKVTKDVGLPPEPKTPSIKERLQKAQAAGIVTPLEGKTPAQKEKILKSMAQAGVPLPEGRTPSEKALISKTQAELGIKPSKKGAGPPTPLSKEAKTLDQRTAKVMKEGKGPSDECICGILTPESEKFSVKAGKTSVAKAARKIPSEKLKKAKAAGLLTPLEGKTPAQKEKIIRGLAMQGLPIPEGKTPSEKKLIDKVRNDLAVAPEPKSGSAKVKYDNAIADGIILPLEGKSPAEKEKVLRAIADRGLALPQGRTPSEKALIAKVKAEPRGVPSERVPSEKLRKAKAAGLLTPIEGKSAAQKEKILKGLAETGMPLPEGKTPSDKALIQRVKTEFGIPKAVTPSEKEIVRKAKAEGLLSPLAGKSPSQKEKTLKGRIEAGLPLPEGKTPSEKQLIKKIRTTAGLPPEATPSEKLGKIKTKSKKVGAAASKRFGKGVGGGGISKAGVVEEFEDVLKTTTCDRGCGCDKKKIRFKHSYVKIRVTSPDISSLCPCPDECVPGVKGGVFVDNEGIKVTVGSAIGFPSFSIENGSKISYYNDSFALTNSIETNPTSLDEVNRENDSKIAYKYINLNANYSNESLYTSAEQNNIYNETVHNYNVNDLETKSDMCETSTSRYLIACSESFTPSNSEFTTSIQDTSCNVTSETSLNSIVVVKTESSLSFSTKSNASIKSISIISFHGSSISSTSSHYLCYQCSRSASSINADDSEYFTNVIDYNNSAVDYLASCSEESMKYSVPVDNISVTKPSIKEVAYNDAYILRISHTNLRNDEKKTRRNEKYPRESCESKPDPIVVINALNSSEDILKLVDEILAKKDIANASSIFVVVPSSDEYDSDLTEAASSTICIRISENFFDWKNSSAKEPNNPRIRQSSKKAPVSEGLKISARGKQFFMECTPTSSKVVNKPKQNILAGTIYKRTSLNKDCQVDKMVINHFREVGMDTIQDRPCCCLPKEPDPPDKYGSNDRCVANAFSELITPMLINQGVAQGLSQNAYLNVPRLNLTDYKSILSSNKTTSVSLCDIPPCSSSYPHCFQHDQKSIQKTMGTQQPPNPNLNALQNISPIEPCKCTSGMAQDRKPQAVPRTVKSQRCGPASCKTNTDSSPAPIIHVNQGMDVEHLCSNCGRPTLNDGRKISCLCSGMEKKIQLPRLCPCEAHKPPLVSTATGSNNVQRPGGQGCLCGDGKKSTNKNKSPCLCNDDGSKRGKKKNIICECPQVEEEPEPAKDVHFEPELFFDATENRKMKSDQTQTTSGFKFNVKKRPPIKEEMSFEEALKYFEENPDDDCTQVDERCFCDEKDVPLPKKTGDINCECPYDPDSTSPGAGAAGAPAEALNGLKIKIGGKGSGSKGLSGICCFDMIQESNGLLLLHD